jgi:formamidopyrimidine-DNA glycosylase
VPELPEVEVIRRALVPRVVGRQIAAVHILESRITRRRGTPQEVASSLAGRTVVALRRRGKFFLFDLDGDSLVVRLGMTGQLRWWETEAGFQSDTHTHATLRFAEGGILSYRDVRKFGEIFLLPTPAVESTLKIGLEPLDPTFTCEKLRAMCRSSGVRIKLLLLNQRKIAGIGNIYADEALFRAGLRPTRRAATLHPDEVQALRRSIRAVLRAGVRHGGSSISDFRNPSGEPGDFAPLHRVYHRHGQPCLTCHTPIRRIILGQRGTHFCPACQQ